jgi:hypothetical protein
MILQLDPLGTSVIFTLNMLDIWYVDQKTHDIYLFFSRPIPLHTARVRLVFQWHAGDGRCLDGKWGEGGAAG